MDNPIQHSNTLEDIIAIKYGIKTQVYETPLVDEVMIAITQVMRPNPNRVGLLFINISANNIFIAPDNDVAAAHGILLVANGGTFSIDWQKDFILPSLGWYGTAGADNSDFYSLEIVAY